MSQTVQDVLTLVEDHLGNYSVGTNSNDKKIRAINRSIEWAKRRIGLPSDEKIYSFLYSQDQYYYDLPSTFDESLLLKYENDLYNTPQYRWDFESYPDLIGRLGNSPNFKYSFTTINGRKQLMMVGRNIRQGTTLEECDAVGNWTALNDASGLALDEVQKYSGGGSLSFDLSASAGYGVLRLTGLALNLDDLFTGHGFVKLWSFFTSANIDDVTLRIMTDASHYYSITADTQDDGNDFEANAWQKIGFSTDDAVATGTPDRENITRLELEFDLGSGFTSAADFRIDHIFTTYPDQIDLVHYSSVKGTDATGLTEKTTLNLVTDKLAIGEMFEDYTSLIAKKAAYELWPQIKGSSIERGQLKADLNDDLKTWARTFPRKRTMNQMMRHSLRRG